MYNDVQQFNIIRNKKYIGRKIFIGTVFVICKGKMDGHRPKWTKNKTQLITKYLEILKMKKLLTAAAIISVISLAGIQTASAHGGNYSNNNDYCGSYGTDDRTFTEKDAEVLEKFRAETNSTRKEIVVKRSELNALLRNDNPDEKRVATLTGDLYDLEAELEAKAETTGVRNRYSYDHGPGMMGTYGRGRHMMGW